MNIFISYRRAEDDKTYIVGTIHERLADVFGSDNVFRDTYDIRGGDEWRSVLENALNECTVMLVMIGPDWANLAYPNGDKRLFDPKDVTRWEVETGLSRSEQKKTTVIPVLIMSAGIPKTEELPPSLSALMKKNVIRIRNYPDFNNDMEELISDIRRSQGYEKEDNPPEHFAPRTIYIAKGPFLMGSPVTKGIPEYELPQHEVVLPAYRIGKYPVKNSEYEQFISQTKTPVSPALGWDGQRVPKDLGNHPVTGLTWYEARTYCDWLTKITGRKYSLPNEAQWEKACRGGNNTVYPWGDEFDPTRCNYGQPSVAPVNKYLAQNDFGCFDLVGNVLQWTCTLWGKKRFPPDPQYGYPWKEDGRNDLSANGEIRRVVRGSTMNSDILTDRCSSRSGQAPEDRGFTGARYSFRVVMSV